MAKNIRFRFEVEGSVAHVACEAEAEAEIARAVNQVVLKVGPIDRADLKVVRTTQLDVVKHQKPLIYEPA